MNKKKTTKSEKEVISEFLNTHKLSGMFLIPGEGTFSYFNKEIDRLLILEHAKIELISHDRELEQEAENAINEKRRYNSKDKTQDRPSYIT